MPKDELFQFIEQSGETVLSSTAERVVTDKNVYLPSREGYTFEGNAWKYKTRWSRV